MVRLSNYFELDSKKKKSIQSFANHLSLVAWRLWSYFYSCVTEALLNYFCLRNMSDFD